jgi:hypothetical protein
MFVKVRVPHSDEVASKGAKWPENGIQPGMNLHVKTVNSYSIVAYAMDDVQILLCAHPGHYFVIQL